MKKLLRTTLLALTLAAGLVISAGAAELPQSKGTQESPATPAVEEGQSAAENRATWDGDAAADDWAMLDPSYGVGGRQPATDEEGRFLSVQALYDHWQSEGWPETVGDMWSADGTMDNLIVAVVDGDEAAMEAIKALLADPSGVTFTACKYSHAELETAQLEIEMLIKTEHLRCILGVGMGIRGDDFTVNGQPCVKVMVTTLEEGGEEWAATLAERYGDKVELEVGPLAQMTVEDLTTIGTNLPQAVGGEDMGAITGATAPWTLGLWAMALLGAVGVAFLALRGRMALRTANGETVTPGRVSRAQAESAVRESAAAPGGESWEKLKEKLD